MIYVLRDGKLVPKGSVREARATARTRADFPTPNLSHLEPYASPIDGREISSWAQRDAEMAANNAYDPRDVSKKPNVRPKPKFASEQLTLPGID
jgi:hypothetical protein